MTLLDRYLIQQFFKNLLFIVFALLSIYFLVDFFERFDNFMEAKLPIELAVRYFLLKVPFMLDMLQPVCILLAGVITLGILNHNHEFMALKAAGISTLRITRPLLLSAAFVTLFALVVAEWILPPTFSETERIWNEEVNHKIPTGIIRNGRTYFRGKEGIYSFVRSNDQQNDFTAFSYTAVNQQFDPQLLLSARQAHWVNGLWTFNDGQLKKIVKAAENVYEISVFEQMTLPLQESPADFFAPTFKASEQSLTALYAGTREVNADTHLAKVNFHSRLSFIFLGIPLILIGIPVILITHQKWGHDLTLAIPLSCGMAFVAWSWWSTAQSMAKAAYMAPFAASWAMYLIICPCGFWLLKRQE